MRKFLTLFLSTSVVLLIVVLINCSPRVSKPSVTVANDVLKNLKYIKDARTGLCFAIVQYGTVGNANDGSIGITVVPCEKVEAFLNK